MSARCPELVALRAERDALRTALARATRGPGYLEAVNLLDEWDRYDTGAIGPDTYSGSPFEARVVAFLAAEGRREENGSLTLASSAAMEAMVAAQDAAKASNGGAPAEPPVVPAPELFPTPGERYPGSAIDDARPEWHRRMEAAGYRREPHDDAWVDRDGALAVWRYRSDWMHRSCGRAPAKIVGTEEAACTAYLASLEAR